MSNPFDLKGPSKFGRELNTRALLSRKQTAVVERMRAQGIEPLSLELPNSGTMKREKLVIKYDKRRKRAA